MNWNNIKKISRQGIKKSFIPSTKKDSTLEVFEQRVRAIERMLAEVKTGSSG